MALSQLAHISIRSADLEASRRFYVDVMGLRVGYRPPFGFPGLWLYAGGDESRFGVVHLIGTGAADGALGAYLGEREEGGAGSGRVDHIAFHADDWPGQRQRCEASGTAYVERTVPALGLRQVFLTDPSGVAVEFNFPTAI